ncbi:hypothetical protein [Rubidibacter lacunae]|nr:hypothetical protein [Rubidibacter lacunae]
MTAAIQRNQNIGSWQALLLLILGLWLGGSLMLDLLVVPCLATEGMMEATGFASVGYALFGTFNHVELVAAAAVLTVIWALHRQSAPQTSSLAIASVLLGCVLLSTYILTPQMSATAMSLDWFATDPSMPAAMVPLHWGYWSAEIVKLLGGAFLLGRYCQAIASPVRTATS